jgi:DNA-binding cell septation regulator SpoVG
MPSVKYEVNGETKYKDVFHPITAEARKEFDAAVIAEYNAAE